MWSGLPSFFFELSREEFHDYIHPLEISDLASSLRTRAKQAQSVHAIPKSDGFILHVGQGFEKKFSA